MNRYSVAVTETELGPIVRLKDSKTDAIAEVIPAIGNNLYRYSVSGKEIIAGPDQLTALSSRSSEYGSAILFPPNRIKNANMSYQDKQYQFPANDSVHHLHGEIRNKPWLIIDSGFGDETGAFVTAELRIADHPDMMSYYPHPLRFHFTYRLLEGRLQLRGDIHNEGTTDAPFGLGFHPYFSCGTDLSEDVEIRVPVLLQYLLDEAGFPVGAPQSTELCDKLREGMRLSEIPLIPDHLLFKLNEGANDFTIIMSKQGYTINYAIDPVFPFMVVFKPAWMNAISLEPYTCATDAFNLSLPVEETGAKALSSEETFCFKWEISL